MAEIRKIACQGSEGAYSNECAKLLYGETEIVNSKTFGEVFDAVRKGECERGVLPIENSTAGGVTVTYELLAESGLFVVDSINMPINHCLLAVSGAKLEDITTVKSHWQAISQCSDIIEKKGLTAMTAPNTALACKALSESGERTVAVIAGRQCAEIYGLDILLEGVQNNAVNFTRFIAISSEPEFKADADTVSISVRVPNAPNSLSNLLKVFTDYEINLKRIQSMHIPNTLFEVRFFIDIEGNIHDQRLTELLNAVKSKTIDYELLGAF